MNKALLGGAIAAALFGGAALGPAVASANGDNGDNGDAINEDLDADQPHHLRSGHHSDKRGGDLAEALGIDHEKLKQGRQAGQTLAETLQANAISVDDAKAALLDQMETRLAQAVADERLTQAQADEKLSEAPERIDEILNRDPADKTDKNGQRHRRQRGHRLEGLDELGISKEDLKAGFSEGKTLAEVAEQAGVSEEDLVASMVAQAMERVDAAIEAGKLTQQQADERTADLEDRITERVNSTPKDKGERGGHRGRR